MQDGLIQYMGAFAAVVIGWLGVVAKYRGWKQLNRDMSEQIRKSSQLIADSAPERADTTITLR